LFDRHDSGHGGWGGCATHDGAGPFRTMAHGDTRIIPVELQESMYPYRIVEFGLREDSAGAGKFRGGLGFRKKYLMLGDADLQAMFDRVKYPPWGVYGGKEGKSGQIIVEKNRCPRKSSTRKKPIRSKPATGSRSKPAARGYGAPSERPRESVERDMMRSYVSAEAAARDYGIHGAGHRS
jgi:N-methylhydantoinase B